MTLLVVMFMIRGKRISSSVVSYTLRQSDCPVYARPTSTLFNCFGCLSCTSYKIIQMRGRTSCYVETGDYYLLPTQQNCRQNIGFLLYV
jgi:hypothetical protein